jgi:molybdate transport system substrate-binding protein
MQGVADAGITWVSEAIFQEQVENPLTHVAIPDADNATAIYAGALVAGAPHPQAANAWLDFIRSPQSLPHCRRAGLCARRAQNRCDARGRERSHRR